MSRAILAFLTSKGYQLETPESVLFLSEPGVHVDAIHPAVRIVLIDGANRYIGNLSQFPYLFDDALVKRISDTLAELKFDPEAPRAQKKIGIGSLQLYQWQWLILAILVILQLCMILIFVLLIFMVT